MSSAPQPSPAAPAPHKTDPFFDSIRRIGLWRTDDRWFGGVAAGIAHRLGIDPLLVRGLFVVFTVIGGIGVLVYGLCWMLLPEASDGRIHLQQVFHGDVSAGFIGAAIMIVMGLSKPVWWFRGGWGWGWGSSWFWGFLFSGLLVAGIIAIIAAALSHSPRSQGGTVPPAATPPSTPVPTPPGTPAHQGTTAHHRTAAQPGTPGASSAPAGAGPVPPAGFRVTPLPAQPASAGTPTPQGVPMSRTSPAPTWTASQPAPGYQTYPAASGTTSAHPMPPAQTPPPVVTPPPAPQYQHKGPGRALVSAVLGLILLAVALVLLFAWGWSNSFALCVGIALVLLGAGIIVAGAMGRSSGVLGFFSIMTMVILVPIGIGTTVWHGFDWGVDGNGPRTFWTDSTFAPTTTQEATSGVSAATGDSTVDLTGLDLSGTTAATVVPVELGAGTVEVTVPANTAVRVEANLGVGQINLRTTESWNTTWDRNGAGPWNSGPNRTQTGSYTEESLGGPGVSLSATSPDWKSDNAAGILLQIHSGTGQVIITEGN